MKIRHVLGISGGKDSAALAIYLKDKCPQLDIEYYFCDTGKELPETYTLVKNLENYLGKKIARLSAAGNSHEVPFDHFLQYKGKFLPSNINRWCTQFLKLQPFEKWIGNDQVISYVGIRADEDREGYISRKPNILSMFPFRQNIWSEEVINRVLRNDNISFLLNAYRKLEDVYNIERFISIVEQPLSSKFTQRDKLELLLNQNKPAFNSVVFDYLKSTDYTFFDPGDFPFLDIEECLVREDIFNLLQYSGVGIPTYYNKIAFEVDGQKGHYSRSRSGCFFCFYQQKIEWVWLFEQHPELFKTAMEYEKDGYNWIHNEPLSELSKPERINQIKREFIKRNSSGDKKSPFLLDLLDDAETEGCATCFI